MQFRHWDQIKCSKSVHILEVFTCWRCSLLKVYCIRNMKPHFNVMQLNLTKRCEFKHAGQRKLGQII